MRADVSEGGPESDIRVVSLINSCGSGASIVNCASVLTAYAIVSVGTHLFSSAVRRKNVQDDASEAFGYSFYCASVISEAMSPGTNILHDERPGEASRMWGRCCDWSDIQGIGL
jgi:hypothetical protein